MTAPAEDHTGEDQFGPFIVEHNAEIGKKAINEVLDKLRSKVFAKKHKLRGFDENYQRLLAEIISWIEQEQS